ncbi:MAG: ATP-NAD kinase family protein [Bacillota bacterium]
MLKRLGLIVNPIAGMGGKVGLKGTDGEEVITRSRELGAVPEAPNHATAALRGLAELKEDVQIVTYPFEMGEYEARECGFEPIVLGHVQQGQTGSEDTRRAAKDLCDYGIDLLMFAGGDGTARDVYQAVRDTCVVLGIPAGVKIHSAVYAINPARAGELARMYLEGTVTGVKEAEVMDLDEEAFRAGRVSAELFGYMKIPYEPSMVQGMKAGGSESESGVIESIAYYVLDMMDELDDHFFILGPGTTVRAIKERLDGGHTLLGVDIAYGKKIVARDVSEAQILDVIKGRKAKIVVTVIGGQGYIFGRGNQQLSARVIEQVGPDNILVVATNDKLMKLKDRTLLVDTGDEKVNRLLGRYMKVITGYFEQVLCRVRF